MCVKGGVDCRGVSESDVIKVWHGHYIKCRKAGKRLKEIFERNKNSWDEFRLL